MATTTLATARSELASYLGYGDKVGLAGAAWTTTTAIAAGTAVVSTELTGAGFADLDGAGSGDDVFRGYWILLGKQADGGASNNDGIERFITAYDASAAQLTVAGANLTAEAADPDFTDFELHRFRPTLLRECLNRAARKLQPVLFLPVKRYAFTARGQIRYEVPSVIVGKPTAVYVLKGVESSWANNILSNAGFETFAAGAFTSWSADTGITVTEETATASPKNFAVLKGSSSAKLVNGTTGTKRDYEQTISSPGTHTGLRVSFSVWVYCLEASSITTQISNDSGDTIGVVGGGGVHRGNGWELLTQTMDYITSSTTLKLGVSFIAGASTGLAIYVDEAICSVGPLQEPESEDAQLLNFEYIPVMEGATQRNEILLPHEMPDNYLLRFEGRGFLSTLTAETDTIELGQPQIEILYAQAAAELYSRLAGPPTAGEAAAEYRAMAVEQEREVSRLMEIHGLYKMRRPLRVPDWAY